MVKRLNLQETVKEPRKKQAEKTDKALLEFITERPGALSLYQIAEETGWSIGRVQKSAARLLKKGLITYRRAFLGGRSLKLLVPTKPETKKSAQTVQLPPRAFVSEFSVPVDLTDSKLWGKKACLYMLDRITLGLSAKHDDSWSKRCFSEVEVPLRREKDAIVAEVPEKIAYFYLLQMSDYVVSAYPSGTNIIVTFERLRTS